MRKYILLCITVVLSLGVAAAITRFQEWGSDMWGIPTWIVAFVLAAVAIAMASKIFKPNTIPPTWILGSIAGYVLLSMLLGTVFAEPVSGQSTAPSASTNPYDHTRSSSVYHAIFVGTSSTSENESTDTDTHASRSGKGGGIILLLIIVLVLLLGSAVIPHFWIAATFTGIVLMAFFTWREFKGRSVSYLTLSTGSPSMNGNEQATIKAHPATSCHPRPYGNGTSSVRVKSLSTSTTDMDRSVGIQLQLGSSASEAFARFWNEQIAEDEHIPPELRPVLQAKLTPQQGQSGGSGLAKPALVTIGGMRGEPLSKGDADIGEASTDTLLWTKLSSSGLIDPTTGQRVGLGTFLWTNLRTFFQHYQSPVSQEPAVISIEPLGIGIEFDPGHMDPEPPESLKLAL